MIIFFIYRYLVSLFLLPSSRFRLPLFYCRCKAAFRNRMKMTRRSQPEPVPSVREDLAEGTGKALLYE